MIDISRIKNYFRKRLNEFGATPQGLDWNSLASQHIRFEQIIKVIDERDDYSLLDFGCGFGSLYDYLKEKGHTPRYYGFDIVEEMVEKAERLHPDDPRCAFFSSEARLDPCDYVVESGVFNVKQGNRIVDWEDHVIDTIQKMNALAKKAMALNFLTSYSDPEYMRSDLYYADPCFWFDYCKKNISKEVALLHDYQLYDFTILIRKSS